MIQIIKNIVKKLLSMIGIDLRKYILYIKKRYTSEFFEESFLIEKYFKKLNLADGIMIDVGAHFGESFSQYLKDGWTVYAFEPDPNPCKIKALNAFKGEKLEIYDLAVSDRSNVLLPFYSSEESTGISSLSSFTSSHKLVKNVQTISIKEFVWEKSIRKIDFLKIDTEGHDLFVLKGLPWEDEKLHPHVILCEFEDKKTKSLGYTYADMGRYLIDKDYVVFISEWYPIERYGVRHKWKKLTKFPAILDDTNGWGNFIAIKKNKLKNENSIFHKFIK